MGKPAISRSGRWFTPEPRRSTRDALDALELEARRRGMTYGQLVSATAEYERYMIVEAYCREKKNR